MNDSKVPSKQPFNAKYPKTESTPNVHSIDETQGSVLGLLLFTLSKANLEKIAASYDLLIHQYANDSQFGASMDLKKRISKSIDEIAAWIKPTKRNTTEHTQTANPTNSSVK